MMEGTCDYLRFLWQFPIIKIVNGMDFIFGQG